MCTSMYTAMGAEAFFTAMSGGTGRVLVSEMEKLAGDFGLINDPDAFCLNLDADLSGSVDVNEFNKMFTDDQMKKVRIVGRDFTPGGYHDDAGRLPHVHMSTFSKLFHFGILETSQFQIGRAHV